MTPDVRARRAIAVVFPHHNAPGDVGVALDCRCGAYRELSSSRKITGVYIAGRRVVTVVFPHDDASRDAGVILMETRCADREVRPGGHGPSGGRSGEDRCKRQADGVERQRPRTGQTATLHLVPPRPVRLSPRPHTPSEQSSPKRDPSLHPSRRTRYCGGRPFPSCEAPLPYEQYRYAASALAAYPLRSYSVFDAGPKGPSRPCRRSGPRCGRSSPTRYRTRRPP